jgi:hypothetical protein
MSKQTQTEKGLSCSVTLLLFMVLMLSAWGATRFLASLRWWNVLFEIEASLNPIYLALTGAVWVAVGCFLLYNIWTGRSWARMAAFTAFLIWLIEYWVERVFFETTRTNLPFTITCSLVAFVIVWLAAGLPGKSKLSLTKKSEEHEQSVEKSAAE